MDLVSFLIASVSLTLMPGPDILFVVTESVAHGRRAGVAIALGLCTGLIAHTVAAALGVAVLLQQSEVALSVVQYLGAAYLFYLAYQSVKHRKEALTGGGASVSGSFGVLYRRGILMNVLNPKVSLFFLAFLPQFTNLSSDALPPGLQMFLLGVLFMIQAVVIFSLVAVIADRLFSRLMNNAVVSQVVGWISALIYAAIGVAIIGGVL